MDLRYKINDFHALALKYFIDRTLTKNSKESSFKESFKIFLVPKTYWSIDDFKKEILMFAMNVEKSFTNRKDYDNRQLQKIIENKITVSDLFKKFVSSSCALLILKPDK